MRIISKEKSFILLAVSLISIILLNSTIYAHDDPDELGNGVISHTHPPDPVPDEIKEIIDELVGLLHPDMIQLSPVNSSYNCHSFVFDNGRSWLEINDTFLEENGYKPIDQCVPPTPQPGDAVIYRVNGVIVHSGRVNHTDGNKTFVHSKWGQMGDYVHEIDDTPKRDVYVSDPVTGAGTTLVPYGNATIYRKC